MAAEARHRRYWEEFYERSADRVPAEPSGFARWVGALEEPPGPLVDIGTGTGRDALWFARQGFRTFGCDYSYAAIEYAAAHAADEGLAAQFAQVDVYDEAQLSLYAKQLCDEEHPTVLYARFFVHALEEDGRDNLWRMCAETLNERGGQLYTEFRIQPTHHEFGEHYRLFVRPEAVVVELEAAGFGISYSEEAHGLAVHKREDPLVARIVARLRAC